MQKLSLVVVHPSKDGNLVPLIRFMVNMALRSFGHHAQTEQGRKLLERFETCQWVELSAQEQSYFTARRLEENYAEIQQILRIAKAYGYQAVAPFQVLNNEIILEQDFKAIREELLSLKATYGLDFKTLVAGEVPYYLDEREVRILRGFLLRYLIDGQEIVDHKNMGVVFYRRTGLQSWEVDNS